MYEETRNMRLHVLVATFRNLGFRPSKSESKHISHVLAGSMEFIGPSSFLLTSRSDSISYSAERSWLSLSYVIAKTSKAGV